MKGNDFQNDRNHKEMMQRMIVENTNQFKTTRPK